MRIPTARLFLFVGLIVGFIGFMLPYWPLVFFGLLLCGAYPAVSILIGMAGDLVFGVPTSFLSAVHVPFTIAAALVSLAYLFASSRLRSRKMY